MIVSQWNTIQPLSPQRQPQKNEVTETKSHDFAAFLHSKVQPAVDDKSESTFQKKIDEEIDFLQKELDRIRNTAEYKNMVDFMSAPYQKQIENLDAIRNASTEKREQWERIEQMLSQNQHKPTSSAIMGVRHAALEMVLADAGDVAEEMLNDAIVNNNLDSLETFFQGIFIQREAQWNKEGDFFTISMDTTSPDYHGYHGIFTNTTREGILEELGEVLTKDDTKSFMHRWFDMQDSEKQKLDSNVENLLAILQNAHSTFAERNLAFIENETQVFLTRFGAK
ncbi:MAG: hypothetical protein K2O85_02495 [Helicobacter sp.]|nr:hypothetical protein [Helicobacter sp.]